MKDVRVLEWEYRGTERFLGGCGHAARDPCPPLSSAFPLLMGIDAVWSQGNEIP